MSEPDDRVWASYWLLTNGEAVEIDAIGVCVAVLEGLELDVPHKISDASVVQARVARYLFDRFGESTP